MHRQTGGGVDGDMTRSLRPGLDERELAAYASVASLLLNLDESITKE